MPDTTVFSNAQMTVSHWPTVGHTRGVNWGTIASLIETCKLNSVDPHAYLANTLTAIVAGHKPSRIRDLLPWNYIK